MIVYDHGVITIVEPGDRVRVMSGKRAYHYDLRDGPVRLPACYGDGSYTVQTYMRVTGNQYRPLRTVKFTATDTAWYLLSPNDLVPETPAWGFARELTEDLDPEDLYGRYVAVKNYVKKAVMYDYVKEAVVPKSGVWPDPLSCWNRHMGICQDIASLLTGMLRAAGVPARLCVGWADGKYHAWVEADVGGRLYRYEPAGKAVRVYVRERWY